MKPHVLRQPEQHLNEPLSILCDVTDEQQVQSLVDGAADRHGRVDVLVNNAGLGGTADLIDMTDEQWLKVIDVTLNGTFRCTRAGLRHMRTRLDIPLRAGPGSRVVGRIRRERPLLEIGTSGRLVG